MLKLTETGVRIDYKQLRAIKGAKTFLKEAAELKGRYPIDYADCIAAATAKTHQASLVICDPEFKKLKNEIKLVWF